MRCIVLVLIALCTCRGESRAGDFVVVRLRDGRTASGALDSATDSSRLWVNSSDRGIALRSGFAWENVEGVVHDSTQRSPEEFRKLVSRLPASKPPLMEDANLAALAVHEVAAAAQDPAVTTAAREELDPPPVRSLRVRAWTANWDDDPELDGVLVEVTPLGPQGEFVPVEGQLTMTLIGEHSPGNPEDLRRFHSRYPEITKGTEAVQREHFWAGPAVYKLPYRTLYPEARLDLFPQGVLTATLGVAGQGNFTASTDALALIPASPIRDRRQQWFGQRYFPQERSRLRDPGRFGIDRKMQFISLGRP
jgi:hypothetical protein